MIDIHSHILYGVDDGAEDFIDSREMLRIAEESGVTDIIATPHSYPGMYDNYNGKTLASRFDRLDRHVRAINSPVQVHRGMEVYADDNVLGRFDSGRLMTLAGSHYLLIECAFNENPNFMTYILRSLRERRIHPIVAHPERYYFINDRMDIALDWVDMGCSLQLNAGSITGYFGRESMETAFALLREGAVQLIASDSHGAITRTPELAEAYERIGAQFSFKYAQLLFTDNPGNVIADRGLEFPIVDRGERPDDFFISDDEYWDQ